MGASTNHGSTTTEQEQQSKPLDAQYNFTDQNFALDSVAAKKQHFSWHGGFLTYTTLTNFITKYLMMYKVYTDVGGIK